MDRLRPAMDLKRLLDVIRTVEAETHAKSEPPTREELCRYAKLIRLLAEAVVEEINAIRGQG